ncbi:MAG TPA: nitrilase-related carbon-nitrogen hydrolase [Candidatus Rifleibacterium sp.]|nr:nitrilase-related carbon-nitrogen hydrolase [Candidatus Rifleibacterium sp.]
MKAGFVQFTPELCNLDVTLRRLEKLLNEAPPADLLVLPELCNTGYNFLTRIDAYAVSEETGKSRFIDFLADYCQMKNMYIVSGFCEREGFKMFNSAILVGPEGLVGKYRKIHLFNNEKDIFSAGDVGLPVFKTPIGNIAMLVCFDWMFPEVWRILALKGADVICHSSALVLPGFAQRSVPIHALINHVYVITANRTGTEHGLTFTGMSTVASPKGEIIYQASAADDESRAFDFDLNLVHDKFITPRNHIFADRRPELYEELLHL